MTFLSPPETINPGSNLKETNLIGWFCQVSYVLDIANRTCFILQVQDAGVIKLRNSSVYTHVLTCMSIKPVCQDSPCKRPLRIFWSSELSYTADINDNWAISWDYGTFRPP